jgi:hypothetical protein
VPCCAGDRWSQRNAAGRQEADSAAGERRCQEHGAGPAAACHHTGARPQPGRLLRPGHRGNNHAASAVIDDSDLFGGPIQLGLFHYFLHF